MSMQIGQERAWRLMSVGDRSQALAPRAENARPARELLQSIGTAGMNNVGSGMNNLAPKLLASPEWPQIALHIPIGTRYLAPGATALAFRQPDGRVLRVGRHEHAEQRPAIREVLQPSARKRIGGWLLEVLPFADTKGTTPQDFAALRTALRSQGYNLHDSTPGNIGRLGDGRLVVVDPGAATPL